MTLKNVCVERFDGSSGTLSCSYETENMGAVAGVDYEESEGNEGNGGDFGGEVQCTAE